MGGAAAASSTLDSCWATRLPGRRLGRPQQHRPLPLGRLMLDLVGGLPTEAQGGIVATPPMTRGVVVVVLGSPADPMLLAPPRGVAVIMTTNHGTTRMVMTMEVAGVTGEGGGLSPPCVLPAPLQLVVALTLVAVDEAIDHPLPGLVVAAAALLLRALRLQRGRRFLQRVGGAWR